MIISGGSRGGPKDLADHLTRTDTNERVRVVDPLCAGTAHLSTHGALQELAAHAAASKCTKPLYSASINPEPGEPELTPDQWRRAVEHLEKTLGMEGHARHVVMHIKRGSDGQERTHAHVVWGRVLPGTCRAWHDGHNYPKHEAAARALERAFGHTRVQGVHVERENLQERPVHRLQDHEYHRAAWVGFDLPGLKALVTGLRDNADSGRAFVAALSNNGLVLARGDRRDFVLVDPTGGQHNVARLLAMRAKAFRAFMTDVDRAALPSVLQATAAQAERRPSDLPRPPHPSSAPARVQPGALQAGPQHDTEVPSQPENGARYSAHPTEDRIQTVLEPGQPQGKPAPSHALSPAAPLRNPRGAPHAAPHADPSLLQSAAHQGAQAPTQHSGAGNRSDAPPGRRSADRRYGDSPLYQRYLAERTARTEARQALLQDLKAQQQHAYTRLSEQHRAREQRVFALFRSRKARNIWRSAVKAKAAQERQAHRRYYGEQRKAVWEAHRPQRWFDWLRDQAAAGDDNALTMLRRRSVREFRATDGAEAFGTRPAWNPPGSRTLYRRYLNERDQWYTDRTARREALYKEQQAAFSRLARRSRLRTSFVRWFVRSPKARKIWAGLIQQVDARERQKLNHGFAQRRHDLDGAKSFDSWAQWLRKQTAAHNPDALATSPTPFAAVDTVPAPDTVVYRVPGAHVQDEGKRLTLSSAANPAAAEAFLHLAYAKFGSRVDVHGSEAFRDHLARAAAITGLPITFADPRMEARRKALQQEIRHASKRQHTHARRDRPPRLGDSPARESYPTDPRRRKPPARSIHDMPRLSTRHVAHDRRAPTVLLQGDAHPDLRQQRPPHPGPDHSLRRHPAKRRLKLTRTRKGPKR